MQRSSAPSPTFSLSALTLCCPPKILLHQERGNDISNLSLSGIFEGAWRDACLKSSFAEHPRQSLPGGVQLSPVLGEAELVLSPREPPGLSHIPVLAPARLCPTWDVL